MATFQEGRASMPDFDPNDPEGYIEDVEAAFKELKITDDESMFNIAHSKLPSNIKSISRSIKKSNENRMPQFKELILEKFGLSKTNKLKLTQEKQKKGLITRCEMLKTLRELQGQDPEGISDIFLESILTNTFSEKTIKLLTIFPNKYTLEQKAKIADSYEAGNGLNIDNEQAILAILDDNKNNDTQSSDRIANIEQTLKNITKTLTQMNTNDQASWKNGIRSRGNPHPQQHATPRWQADARQHATPRWQADARGFADSRWQGTPRWHSNAYAEHGNSSRSFPRNPGDVNSNRYNLDRRNQTTVCFYHRKYYSNARRCEGRWCTHFDPQKHSFPKNDAETDFQ